MMQSNFVNIFFQEAEELLNEIEDAALTVTNGQGGEEAINRIFRAFHTIKGSGAMFGFTELAGFTHHVETLLDQVRDGIVLLSQQLSDVILAATDHIKLLLQAVQGGPPVDSAVQSSLLAKVHQLSATTSQPSAVAQNTLASAGEASLQVWNIRFRPHPSIFAQGNNPLLLLRDLKALGECQIEGHLDGLPSLADFQYDTCYLWWTIQLKSACNQAEIHDVFMFVEDGSELYVEAIPTSAKLRSEAQHPDNAPTPIASKEATVRVPAERLDRLVNLVGELVMNQSRLATAASRFTSPELAAPVEEIERLIGELRDDVLQIRMMPIGSIFGRFRRLVRDLSIQLGKQIDLVTEGEETELDKSILDQLSDPLIHLLRNSIDHGIEIPARRLASGKREIGTIRLTADHHGSDVVVTIEDDGAGLNREAIRAKAIARQLISPDAVLSDKEVANLILLPGFSTAQTITDVSGRGVGMDVVKRQIDVLRGSLSINSEAGKGTSILLTLPLTLAIIEGLLVEAAASQYIIPMAAVMENVELRQTERLRNNGRNIIAVRGELIPYIDLREYFGLGGQTPAISKVVIVRYEDKRVGMAVDRVMGTHQTVIQALGHFFREIGVVSGSTVMGDGRVALILDIAGVIAYADRRCKVEAA